MSRQNPSLSVRTGIRIASIPPDLLSFIGGSLIAVAINILTSLIWVTIHFFMLAGAVASSILIGISSILCISLGRTVTELWSSAEALKSMPFSDNKDKNHVELFEILLESEDLPSKFKDVAIKSLLALLLLVVAIGCIVGGKALELRSLDRMDHQDQHPFSEISPTPEPTPQPSTSTPVARTCSDINK